LNKLTFVDILSPGPQRRARELEMPEDSLPDAELDVMVCLWQHGPQTARALREALESSRPMTHASISTLLMRLIDKGLVAREKGGVGKAFIFRALAPPDAIQRHLVSDLLDRVFGGSGIALVSTLLESRRPTPSELDELSALLEQLRSRKKTKAVRTEKGKRSAGS
jgi:BlaI family transcriptional regulator, penicillinase repressor